ncbi:MAG: class I SAM-dependent methyltransferase [Ignavibacteria bacterium]|nr:class I SAM-dependent methyltransferase [Ignavibacteria bacterium]
MAIFDSEAENYDLWYTSKLGSFVDEIETNVVLELLEPSSGMKVLDVGCGTGNFSLKLAKLKCIVTGIDISTKMLEIAQHKAKKENLNIEFLNGNAENLPFEDNFFDSALSVATFEFIDNPQKALNEIFRVTKPNGKIVIGFINRQSLWGELYSSEEFRKNTIFKYAKFFTPDEIINIRKKEFIRLKEALFIPPDIREEDISSLAEERYKKINKPGFFVGLWKKIS